MAKGISIWMASHQFFLAVMSDFIGQKYQRVDKAANIPPVQVGRLFFGQAQTCDSLAVENER